jgi:DNA-binding transcriptional MerR regulator/effector-binding domain-containing protein
MLKIRDFARLGEVSMVTLRHYDEIGLLKPDYVDPDTGYRFYTIDQLSQLHRILALKDLGLGLAQIIKITNEGLSPQALQGMLRLRQAELQQRVQTEQEQIARIEARLQDLEQGCHMPTYEIILKTARPITAVSRRISPVEITHKWDYANALLALMKQYGIKPIDHLLLLYEEFEDENRESELQIAIPVERSKAIALVEKSDGYVELCELPAVPIMASILHHGSPYTTFKTLQVLGTWIETNKYTITGDLRRGISLQRTGELDGYITEIQFPVKKSL